MRRLLTLIALLLVGGAAHADPLELEGKFIQGGLVLGHVPPGSEVRFAGHRLRVDQRGRFVFGFGRDEAPTVSLIVRYPDGTEAKRRLEVAKRDYEVQRINGLPPSQVTPSAKDLVKIRADARLIDAAKARDTAEAGFAEAFIWPVTGPISGVYGSQRILNGKPRQPHRGVDVAAPAGTLIVAPADGVISLATPDMYFTGGTVMIDHGHGLESLYAHMRSVRVAVGQTVRQGEVIGEVGATGRVTGAHLHWGVFWFERAIDPALLVGPMPPS